MCRVELLEDEFLRWKSLLQISCDPEMTLRICALPCTLRQRVSSLRRVVELTGDTTPDIRAVARADVIVTTPEKWDGISRSWQTRGYVKAVALLVIDEIHLLGEGTALPRFLDS